MTEPAASSSDSSAVEVVTLITALDQLRAAGLLTEQEFEHKKRQILARL